MITVLYFRNIWRLDGNDWWNIYHPKKSMHHKNAHKMRCWNEVITISHINAWMTSWYEKITWVHPARCIYYFVTPTDSETYWNYRKTIILNHCECSRTYRRLVILNSNEHDDVIKWKHFPRYWPFVGDFTAHRWIPRTKASDAVLWCFLWSAPE